MNSTEIINSSVKLLKMSNLDVLSEGSSYSKVLTQRHVSPEKPLDLPNNAITSPISCHNYTLQPDFGTYLEALGGYAWVLWCCGLVMLIAICALYVITMRSAMRHWKQGFVSVAVLLAVYPLVAAAGFLAVLVPRARLLAEAAAQETVMIAMYHLFSLILAESGGVDQLVRQAGGASLETRVPPCCCWPCCVIPRPKLQKQSISVLRYLVLQMPVIQSVIYLIILVLWAEDMSVYLQCFIYLQPFVAASILTGVWAIIMSVRMAESSGLRIKPRFLALQLVLIIVKLQCGFAKMLPELVTFRCIVELNPSVFANLIQNSLMMLEMLLLSIWAWRLYRVPPGKNLEKAIHVAVAVLDDNPKAIEVRTPKDGVENKSYDK